MHLRSIGLGVAIGFLAAWLLLATPCAREATPSSAPPEEPASSADTAEPGPASRPDSEPASPRPISGRPASGRLEVFRTGDALELQKVLNARTPATAAEAEVLIRRVDQAREEGDRHLFYLSVAGLAESGTRRAREKLHALLADETLSFPMQMAWQFWKAFLKDGPSDLSVLARRRYEESERSERPDTGWLHLIAIHGSEEDLDWLLEKNALRPLIASGRPAAAKRLRPLLVKGELPKDCFGDLAKYYPGMLFEELPALIERGAPGGKTSGGSEAPRTRTLFRAYGACVSPGAVAPAKAFLLGQREPRNQIAAVYSVQSMVYRKLDVSGLEPVVLTPTYYLERATPKIDFDLVGDAREAIERNRIAWSERAVAALRLASESHPGQRQYLLDAALKIETNLKSGCK